MARITAQPGGVGAAIGHLVGTHAWTDRTPPISAPKHPAEPGFDRIRRGGANALHSIGQTATKPMLAKRIMLRECPSFCS